MARGRPLPPVPERFPESLIRDCQDVIGKIQVAGRIGAADIVFLVSPGSNQAFGVGDDLVIAALPGGIFRSAS